MTAMELTHTCLPVTDPRSHRRGARRGSILPLRKGLDLLLGLAGPQARPPKRDGRLLGVSSPRDEQGDQECDIPTTLRTFVAPAKRPAASLVSVQMSPTVVPTTNSTTIAASQ